VKLYEKKLQNALLLSLGQRRDTRVWRHNVGRARPLNEPDTVMQFGRPGQSDIFGITRGGRLLCIECKAASRVTPEQQSWLAMVKQFGGVAIVAKLPARVQGPDEDWEDAIRAEVARVNAQLDQL
jgi:hypothetical protein